MVRKLSAKTHDFNLDTPTPGRCFGQKAVSHDFHVSLVCGVDEFEVKAADEDGDCDLQLSHGKTRELCQY